MYMYTTSQKKYNIWYAVANRFCVFLQRQDKSSDVELKLVRTPLNVLLRGF